MLARISQNFPLVTDCNTSVAARLLSIMALASLTVSLNADDGFPYRAVVETPDASVQSGPGIEFYATDRLAKGTQVEVWRHDADGWCAIRPPADSFSWVLAEHLEMTDDPKLARVINAPVKTRIGSRFSDARDVEYISLRTGEAVELVGTKELTGPDSQPQRWFRIAPPSGEFRWIHSDSVRRIQDPKGVGETEVVVGTEDIRTFDLPSAPLPPQLGAGAKQGQAVAIAEPKRLAMDNAFIEVERITSSEPQSLKSVRDSDVLAASFEATAQAETASSKSDQAGRTAEPSLAVSQGVASDRRDDIKTHTGSAPSTAASFNTVTWEAVGDPTDVLAAPEPRSFQENHDALNLMLSRSVLGDIQSWDLSDVRRQTELLLVAARTLEEESLAESLLAKVDEFRTLQDRSRRLAATPDTADGLTSHEVALTSYDESGAPEQLSPGEQPQTPRVGRKPTAVSSVDSSSPSLLPSFQPDQQLVKSAVEMPRRIVKEQPAAASHADLAVGTGLKRQDDIDNSIFDASGLLIAVQARRTDMPRYALTNSSGEITQFVATQNRTDLRRFLNKRVGVLGEVGYLRKLNKPYVAAQRIVLLRN